MPRTKPEGPYRDIPLNLIDEPPLPMRQTFDTQALDELTESVQRMGVLQPISVEQTGGRFRIQDGHRRYIASVRAGRPTIPAVIRGVDQVSGEAVKVHANLHREDVNPAEQAVYFQQLLESQCNGDVDRLCELTSLRRPWVEDRLCLLAGDPDVLDALRGRRISLAVAKELNKCKDRGYRMMYLDAAVRGGASARIVQEWRVKSEAFAPAEAPPPTTGENQFSALPPPITQMCCLFCESTAEPWEMELVPMHRRCRALFLDRILARLKQMLTGMVEEVTPHGPSTTRPQ